MNESLLAKFQRDEIVDLNTIQLGIQKTIAEIMKLLNSYFDIVDERVGAIAAYKSKKAEIMVRLKLGEEFKLKNGKIFSHPIASNAEAISEMLIENELKKYELSEANYKMYFSRLDALKAQLNGLQSMKRSLIDSSQNY